MVEVTGEVVTLVEVMTRDRAMEAMEDGEVVWDVEEVEVELFV